MSEIQISNRFWVDKDGKAFLGYGRIRLLEEVSKTGSISKAAKSPGMSYKRAWQLIQSINELSDEPIVERSIGGSGGGGSLLTTRGKKIIKEFNRIENLCDKLLKRELEKCCF
ncbi:MAG: LysR family transcriptional regulator [Bacteroidales bacterium]|nr:LysR family transcriptional regulator [Bacteroidales bacterium]